MKSSMISKRHEGKSSSSLMSCFLCTIFIKSLREIQSIFANLLDFISNFQYGI